MALRATTRRVAKLLLYQLSYVGEYIILNFLNKQPPQFMALRATTRRVAKLLLYQLSYVGAGWQQNGQLK
ncbi:MAG: hypothetical protein WC480_04685 [Patescibacteria group bacterium]